jgi:uncharacterized protein (DUF362 family)
MKKDISRRSFVAGTLASGALFSVACRAAEPRLFQETSELTVASGPDIAKNIRAAVDGLGGIGQFVKPGQTVAILVSILGSVPSAHTKPDTIRTVTAMCREAGAKEVSIVDWREISRWEQNKLIEIIDELDLTFRHIDRDNPDLWHTLEVPRGKALTSVRVFNALYESDVFITLPIFKHHSGTGYTGALKLFMGVSHPDDNRQTFHRERGRYLEQCIADLNTAVRPPDLIIMDAMEVITARGPVGPGPTVSPMKIVAGTDRVALDTYCAPIQSIDPASSIQIKAAFEHGLGQMALDKVSIKEINTV